jgi:hypothetical protein
LSGPLESPDALREIGSSLTAGGAASDAGFVMASYSKKALLFALVLAGCTPASAPVGDADPATVQLKQVCETRCACESCRREEAGACAIDARNTPALARRAHCDAPLALFAKCAAGAAVCLGGRFVDEGCEKEQKALDACVGR